MAAPGTASKAPVRGASGNGSIVLLLSLFLLLLVFFIMLNAQSVQQVSRVKAVLASVERSFDFVIDPRLRDGNDPVASRTGTVFAVERLNGVGDLFATTVAVAKVTTVTPGALMEVRLDADELFEPGTATLRRDRAGLLDRVAESLRKELPGERIELDYLVALSPDRPSQPPGPIERAAALARDLVARGVPAESVTIGIERGAPGASRFLFTIRSTDERARGGRR
ncbi:hypothetical protein [Azospirillum sp.]|uniref:hypothetical protein n=1 Tax=Azospirillum sp. TaxID=34012 RepID=UPI002D3F6615|nr:hypothetical protein [Azospirillum sp.]HYD67468.1 hypothetical protein [Azospirillum sp.]